MANPLVDSHVKAKNTLEKADLAAISVPIPRDRDGNPRFVKIPVLVDQGKSSALERCLIKRNIFSNSGSSSSVFSRFHSPSLTHPLLNSTIFKFLPENNFFGKRLPLKIVGSNNLKDNHYA